MCARAGEKKKPRLHEMRRREPILLSKNLFFSRETLIFVIIYIFVPRIGVVYYCVYRNFVIIIFERYLSPCDAEVAFFRCCEVVLLRIYFA